MRLIIQDQLGQTIAVDICAFGREIKEEKDDEDEDPSCLQVSRSLTLRHPGGFDFLQDAGGASVCACTTISSWFFVWIVCSVSVRQRNGRTSHKGEEGLEDRCESQRLALTVDL